MVSRSREVAAILYGNPTSRFHCLCGVQPRPVPDPGDSATTQRGWGGGEHSLWSCGLNVTEAALQTHRNCGYNGCLNACVLLCTIERQTGTWNRSVGARHRINYSPARVETDTCSVPPLRPLQELSYSCRKCVRFVLLAPQQKEINKNNNTTTALDGGGIDWNLWFWNTDANRESVCAWIIYLCATFVASEAWTLRERMGRTDMKTPAEGRVCCVYVLLGMPPTSKASSSHARRKRPQSNGLSVADVWGLRAMTRGKGSPARIT